MRKTTSKAYDKLTPDQKQALISWISEGLSLREIKQRACAFNPSFRVKQQQIHYFRKSKQLLDADLMDQLRGSAQAAGLEISEKQLRQIGRNLKRSPRKMSSRRERK